VLPSADSPNSCSFRSRGHNDFPSQRGARRGRHAPSAFAPPAAISRGRLCPGGRATFLGALSSKGITFAARQAAIAAGHEVCDELDQDRQASDVANNVMTQTDLDGYHAGFFVGVSIAAFCPRHSQ
jgi:Protein of unknown function (DUF732)